MPPKHITIDLKDIHVQANENARMYAKSRFSNLSAFLTYVGILTAALAVLFSGKVSSFPTEFVSIGISFLGILVSLFFFALEIRHHHWWKFYQYNVIKPLEMESNLPFHQSPTPSEINSGILGIRATTATYSIYVCSVIFFLTVLVLLCTFPHGATSTSNAIVAESTAHQYLSQIDSTMAADLHLSNAHFHQYTQVWQFVYVSRHDTVQITIDDSQMLVSGYLRK
jgi:hypothetical protein